MLRIATFNVENLDASADEVDPELERRVPVLRHAFSRMAADIICLQEVHGQELPEHTSSSPKRVLSALDTVLAGTRYAAYARATTLTDGVPYNERNLVVLAAPSLTIEAFDQHRNSHVETLLYRKVTATDPPDDEAKDVTWERPILHVQVQVPGLGRLHVLNLHLKSRLSSRIPGQSRGPYSWHSAAGWAEGYFLSSIKRVGQALEARLILDEIFDAEPEANIVVCGDFNAEPGEVPVEAICGRVENTNNAALRSRVLVPCSRGIPMSVRFTHLHHGHGNLLDHVLVSQSVLPFLRHAEIHNENLPDESLPSSADSKFPESDHAPFIATFEGIG
jgi:endonuclease/exonuclease/phosphatase family metal-dependent hydrolase